MTVSCGTLNFENTRDPNSSDTQILQPKSCARPAATETMESSRSSKSKSSSSRPRVCRSCGQHHSHHEPHIYDYPEVRSSDLVIIESQIQNYMEMAKKLNKDLMSKNENIFSGRGRGLDVPDLPPTLCGTHRHPLLSYFLSGGILVTIFPSFLCHKLLIP